MQLPSEKARKSILENILKGSGTPMTGDDLLHISKSKL